LRKPGDDRSRRVSAGTEQIRVGVSAETFVAQPHGPSAKALAGGVTYDTGELVAAERDNRQVWALHAGYLTEEVIPTVPAPVLAEAWRGGSRQASLALARRRGEEI
jgi:hypothetical protein